MPVDQVVSGGPGEEAVAKPAAAAVAELIEVDLGGTKIKVDKATADAIAASQTASATALAAAKAEAEEARRAKPPAKPAPAADPADPLANIDTELFADPKAAIKKVMDVTAERVTTSLTAQYQAERNRDAFWSEFYSENKDLAGERMIVGAVFSRDFSKLENLKAADAAKALATAAKTELLRLKGESGGAGGKPPAEGGNEPGKPRSKPDNAKPVKSISDVIRSRKAARSAPAQRQAA